MLTLAFVVGILAVGSPTKSKMGGLVYVFHVSSNANNGSNAGVFTANANNDSGNRNRNIGSQLAVGV